MWSPALTRIEKLGSLNHIEIKLRTEQKRSLWPNVES